MTARDDYWVRMPDGGCILTTRDKAHRLAELHRARCIAAANGDDLSGDRLPIVVNGRLYFPDEFPTIELAGVPFVHRFAAGKWPKGPRGPRSEPVAFGLDDLRRAWHELRAPEQMRESLDRYRDDLAVSLGCEPRQIVHWFPDPDDLPSFREFGHIPWGLSRALGLPGGSSIA